MKVTRTASVFGPVSYPSLATAQAFFESQIPCLTATSNSKRTFLLVTTSIFFLINYSYTSTTPPKVLQVLGLNMMLCLYHPIYLIVNSSWSHDMTVPILEQYFVQFLLVAILISFPSTWF